MKLKSKHAIRVAADFLCTASHKRLSQGGEPTLFSEFVELLFHKLTGKPKDHRSKAKKENKNRNPRTTQISSREGRREQVEEYFGFLRGNIFSKRPLRLLQGGGGAQES